MFIKGIFIAAVITITAGTAQAEITRVKTEAPQIQRLDNTQTWPAPHTLPQQELSASEARMRLLVILAAQISGGDHLFAQN